MNNSNSINTDKRICYLDLLRIFACLAVILLHTAAIGWGKTSLDSPSWFVLNFYDSISRWCVPVFVMISGAVNLTKKPPLKKVLTKQIPRILLYLYTASFFFYVMPLLETHDLNKYLVLILKAPLVYWYLFLQCALYLISPCLYPLTESPKTVRNLLFLMLPLAFLLPQAASVSEHLLPNTYKVLEYIRDQTKLGPGLEYLWYYLCGWYLHHESVRPRVRRSLLAASAVGFAATFWFTHRYSLYLGQASSLFYENNTLNVLLQSVGVFLLVQLLEEKLKPSSAFAKWSGRISNLTFLVYLLHVFVLRKWLPLLPYTIWSFPTPISVPVFALGMALVCFPAAALLQKCAGICSKILLHR